MEFNELELLESGHLVRESDNNNEAHLRGADDWQFLYPEVERECIVYKAVSGSSNNHLRADSITASIDHDPVATFKSPCSSSLIPSEDLYQEKDQSGNKSNGYDKNIGFTSSSKAEEGKSTFAMDSPTKQMMERDEDYDPSRIPSSVFERSDSLAQTEWSAASNESLFSLHGGISFGRDQAVVLGSESHRVRDLSKLDELKSNPPSDSDDIEVVAEERELVKDKTKEEDGEKAHSSEEELAKLPSAVMGSSVSCRSDASDGSTFSFAFPILAPGRAQNSSTKGVAFSPYTSHSREPQSEPENFMGTPQPPSTTKKKKCCFSCFTICSLPSFCSCSFCCHPRCSSCWPFKS